MTKGKFIKAVSGKKRGSENYFYLVQTLVGDNIVNNFGIEPEDFKKMVEKKPQLLKDYNFVYENKIVYGKVQPVLVDIQDIK